MKKEEAKHLAEVLKAYAEGKPIEVFLDNECEWREVPTDGYRFDVENESYRIKKEPKYRPFINAEECFNEMQKHQPIGWLYWNNVFVHITEIGLGCIAFDNCKYSFVEAFNHGYTFADGQPFGIKEH